MAAAAAKPKLIAVNLREDLALGLAALPAGQKRVDREKKIIHGVKMLAGSSVNTHGVEGVDGTDYTYEAVHRAVPIYEGLKANVDHPPRESPNQERSAYDRLGKYVNVRAERCKDDSNLGEMRGDLHLLPSHELTESMLDSAEDETLNDCFSLSHNARGRGEVRGRRYVITEIPEARSVDVVADGGGTRTIFESKERPVKTKLGKVILESKLKAPLKAVLLEQEDLMDTDVAEDEGESPDAWKDHLMSAVAALVKKDDPDAHACAKRILKMLAPEAKGLEEGEDEEDKDRKDGKDVKEGADEKDKDKKDAACDMKESREESKALLQVVGLKAEGPLLEALAGVKGLKAKLAIVNELKNLAGSGAGNGKPGHKPPPGAPRDNGKQIQESKEVKTDDLLDVRLY